MTATCTVIFGYLDEDIELFAGVIPATPHALRRIRQEITRTYGKIPYGIEEGVPWHHSSPSCDQVHVVTNCHPAHSVAVAAFDTYSAAQECAEEQAHNGRATRITTTMMGQLDPQALHPGLSD